jgi:hypothetical protein
MTAHPMDRAIEALARNQHGVFSIRQAQEHGATPGIIRRRRDNGQWQQLSRTVWTLPSAPPTWHRQVMAAVLSLPGASVSGLAAGHLHVLDGFRPVRPELTVPRGGSRRSPFATVHQSDRARVTRSGPFPVVTVEQALCDAAGRLGPRVDAVIEADGRPWHTRRADFERDRRRDHTALVHDHRTLRFTHLQLAHEAEYVLGVLLAVGAHTPPAARS